MEDGLILPRKHLAYWLRQLKKERLLIAPVKDISGDIFYSEIERIEDIELNPPASLPSLKEFFTPQYEPLFRIEKGEGHGDKPARELIDSRRRCIFGVRSCDISALKILDRFYSGKFSDPYYRSRRENTVLISIVCSEPDPSCFCSGLNTGPYLEEGYDIQLVELEGRFFVDTGSMRGREIIDDNRFLFTDAHEGDREDRFEVFLNARAKVRKNISLDKAGEIIKSEATGEEFWKEIARNCIECGGCVYSCPLCTCFTVTDREYDDYTERIRIWDTCLLKGFTWRAGGLFPEKEKEKRIKRWYFHKLVHFKETSGCHGCVGCGRCARACPSGIHMAVTSTRIKGFPV
jgi:sulfhydrogenase subunit beta (sulfur reductase)